MEQQQNNAYKYIIGVIAAVVVILGIILYFIPPALFPDPGNGFQVLRCMQLGGSFNTLVSPDQSDISQNYSEFLTWWSPGQYLVPYFFKLVSGLNLGKAIAITITFAQLAGLAGFYQFFKRIGFNSLIAAFSLLFIVLQQAFVVPYVFYSGGELLLFAFEGWFLYGCVALKKADLKLLLFVLFSGWLGFFLKSSFIWMYIAGLTCLWIRIATAKTGLAEWIKNGLWIAIPAAISLAVIYISFLSKGQSPASGYNGIKLTAETFTFPLASPLLSAFSIDDLFHGLFFHTGKVLLDPAGSLLFIIVLAILSVLLIFILFKRIPNKNYRLFVTVFYLVGVLFLGTAYLRQLTISYEARHFRIIGILIVPGMIYLISNLRPSYRLVFISIAGIIGFISVSYVITGLNFNHQAAHGSTGVAQPNIDQASLKTIIDLDRRNRNAVFVFISDDIGLEVLHNRIITLQPISDALKIDIDDYRYDGFAGPLYIVLPESYNGPREKMIMKSFPGYAGWSVSMLSPNYVLYSAKMKR
jgi:hypothetical protein